jgi:hypothetical protein
VNSLAQQGFYPGTEPHEVPLKTTILVTQGGLPAIVNVQVYVTGVHQTAVFHRGGDFKNQVFINGVAKSIQLDQPIGGVNAAALS